MNKVERIKTALRRERPDKLPYSFWTHLPGDDQDPVINAERTYEFFKTYDLDFIKMMNNGVYSCVDFGCEIDFSEVIKGGASRVVKCPINKPEDWAKLEQVDPTKGVYGRELKYLDLLMDKVKGEAPVVFTVFSPMTTVDKIVDGKMIEQISQGYGEAIHHALEIITETTCQFVREIFARGADGIFLATKFASLDMTTEEIYAEYGKPYDVRILNTANEAGGWFNILHAHGTNIMFDLVRDYPTHAFNWHAFETLPTLSEARDITGKCLVGGMQRYNITDRKKLELMHEIYTCLTELKGTGHILTPGCTIRYPLDDGMLRYVRETKEYLEHDVLKMY